LPLIAQTVLLKLVTKAYNTALSFVIIDTIQPYYFYLSDPKERDYLIMIDDNSTIWKEE
jgi:L-lysine 2,3-aminomutase